MNRNAEKDLTPMNECQNMGPITAWNQKTDTRGTQTDLVTDRIIADCLMELKSTAEFQDLAYRLSRSCTGEMTLTVTRDSAVGLLGAPFDPVCITVTASGLCYFSVLFTPVEIVDLKPNGDLNLRKFRHVLWKLNGRAGYGFCPGFKENDFPDEFQFDLYGFDVVRQPFTRIQSVGCRVFLQLRRSSSRAASQPLGLQLCSGCLKALTELYSVLKNSGEGLSLPVFAKFLPVHSHPPLPHNRPLQQSSCKSKGEVEKAENYDSNQVSAENVPVGEEVTLPTDSPGSSMIDLCETETDNTAAQCQTSKNKPTHVKSKSNKLGVRDCSVLLDRVIPDSVYIPKGENASDISETASASTYSIATSESMALVAVSGEMYPSSSSSWSLSSPAVANASSNSARPPLQVSAESSLSRPVLSAWIKPFRTVAPHGREMADTALERADCDLMESASSKVMAGRDRKHETSPDMEPPVLVLETTLSPDSSPQPLLIDEDANPEELESAVDEPESKRPCLRCPVCQEAFPSQMELQQHCSQHHQLASDDLTHPTSAADDSTSEEPSQVVELSQSPRSKMCPICHSSFGSKDELETHLRSRHRTRLHPCRYCGQTFALKKNLADHLERHRGSKMTCKECGRKFSKKKEFAAHVREHMGSLPYFCTVCSKLFSREKVYEEHMERHRTRRGVRALLTGNEKTMQGIMNKAKKCLEERALVTPPSTGTESAGLSSLPAVNHASSSSVLSAPASDALTSAPSNLHLLSVVSLAQAELDRQPNEDSMKLTTSHDAKAVPKMDSSQAAVQLLEMSSGQSSVNSAVGSSTTVENYCAANSPQTLSPSKSGVQESDTLMQKLNSPIKLPGSPQKSFLGDESGQPESEKASQPEPPQELNSIPPPAELLSGKAVETASGLECSASTEPQSKTNQLESDDTEQARLLAERENRVKQKEQELEELKASFAKKNLFIHHLILSQLAQQSKAAGGPGAQGKGDKPTPQQALAMLAAMNSMGGRGIGRGTPLFRPPGPGGVHRPGKIPPRFHGNVATVPGSAEMKGKPQEQGVESKAEVTASLSQPSVQREFNKSDAAAESGPGSRVEMAGKQPPLIQPSPEAHGLPPAAQSGLRPFPSPPGQRPLLPAAVRPPLPPPPPPMPSTSQRPTPAPRPEQLMSKFHLSAQARLPGTFFLEELMKLESKMPASAKEFLPPALGKERARSSASPKTSMPMVVVSAETSENIARSISRGKGRAGKSSTGGAEDKAGKSGQQQKKRNAWSGGMLKETMKSVVTMVPPQEMKRLLSMSRPQFTVTAPTLQSSASSQPDSSPSMPSSAAPSPMSSEAAGSSQGGRVTPFSQSATHSPPNPAVCTTVTSTPHISPAPSPRQQPMPHLIPASALASADSQRQSWMSSAASPPTVHVAEEAGPMDLTKGKSATSGKGAASGEPKEAPAVPESVVLRRVLLDTTRDQFQTPRRQAPAAEARVSPNADVQVLPSQSYVPPQAMNSHDSLQVPMNLKKQPSATEASASPVVDAPMQPGPGFAPPQGMVNPHDRLQALRRQAPVTETAVPPVADVPMQPGQTFVPPQGMHPQAAALHARIQASLQAVQDPGLKSEGMALLRHFLPSMVAQQAAAGQRTVGCKRMVSPRFAPPPQNRVALSPQHVMVPHGMPSPRGRVPQQGAWPTQEGVSLGRSPSASSSGIPSSTGSMPSPAGATLSPAGSVPSPASVGAVHSPGNVGLSPTAAMPSATSSLPSAASSLPSSPAPLTSPNSNTISSPPHPTVNAPPPSVANFLLPPPPTEAGSAPDQQAHSTPVAAEAEEEKSKPPVFPLGGFAWHRPAAVDPFITVEREETVSAFNAMSQGSAPSGDGATQEADKNHGNKSEIDRADENLWQQQFLETLREKRRLQQDQQQRQQRQHRQQIHEAISSPPQDHNLPSQRGKRPKKTVTNGMESASGTVDSGIHNASFQHTYDSSAQHHSEGVSETAQLINSTTQQSCTRGRRKGSRGRPRGRPRKNASQPVPRVVGYAAAPQGMMGELDEGGTELRGFGVNTAVKIEPLEAGVHCTDCDKVLFDEAAIMEHDCDAQ